MSEIILMHSFGRNLNDILDEYKMSQKELSEETGISESMISRYIKGECMPSLKNVINIMIVLECDFEELIDIPMRVI